MIVSAYEHGQLDLAHSDERRDILEHKGGSSSVQRIVVRDAVPMGNHYHARKDESFVILKGFGSVLLRDVTSLRGPTIEERLIVGTVIRIPAMWAHAFLLAPGSEMLCFSSSRFDPRDLDMHPYHLR